MFQTQAVPLREAWRLYDRIMMDPRIVFAEEPAALESYWRIYTRRRSFSPKIWSDAYLAAFARAAGLAVVTFDKAFAQYKQVHCTVLS